MSKASIIAIMLICLLTPLLSYGGLSEEANAWVNSTLKGLSLEEKIGQMMFPMSTDPEELKVLIKKYHIGGFFTWVSNPIRLAQGINEVQRYSKLPLLISMDEERGLGRSAYKTSRGPGLMAIAATGQPENAFKLAQIEAREARAVGIHWIYMPVVDVNNNPANPIINIRSFGDNVEQVSSYAVAMINGFQSGGLIATAKHFPGHGDTSVDSHLALPVIEKNLEQLFKLELIPFKRAITEGKVGSIMTAHIALPKVTGSNVPATISPKILNEVLRQKLGFDGIIVTDSLGMHGIRDHYTPTEVVLKGVEASVDVFLNPRDLPGMINTIHEAVKTGKITEKRIDESVERILSAKARLGLHKKRTVDLLKVAEILADPTSEQTIRKIARRTVTLPYPKLHFKQIGQEPPEKLLVISVTKSPSFRRDGSTIKVPYREFLLQGAAAEWAAINKETKAEEFTELLDKAGGFDRVVLCCYFFGVDKPEGDNFEAQLQSWAQKLSKKHPQTILLHLGNPYTINLFPGIKNVVMTFTSNFYAQQAAVEFCYGKIKAQGKMPIRLPGG